MDSALDFLRAQVDDVIARHAAFVHMLEDDAGEVEDVRVRNLCEEYLPRMRAHQAALEEFRANLGTGKARRPVGIGDVVRDVAGRATDAARALADVPGRSDLARLVATMAVAADVEAAFKTFRDAGRTLGIRPLARIGEVAERHHDAFAQDAARLRQQLFLERARGAEHALPAEFRSGSDLHA